MCDSAGPVQLTRYNMFPAASINDLPRPGTSTGDALATMEALSRSLPRNLATEWTEVSYLQKQASKLDQLVTKLPLAQPGPNAGHHGMKKE